MARSPQVPGATRGLLSLTLTLILTPLAYAEEDVDVDALVACKAIVTAEKRLECYDRAMNRRQQPKQADTRSSLFGRDDRTKADMLGRELGIEEPEDITSTIENVATSAYGKIVVTLSNDQTWQQLDDARLPLSKGDPVTVRRASFGSYLLEKAEGSRTIRVKRIDN